MLRERLDEATARSLTREELDKLMRSVAWGRDLVWPDVLGAGTPQQKAESRRKPAGPSPAYRHVDRSTR
jgi:hypothetical protein